MTSDYSSWTETTEANPWLPLAALLISSQAQTFPGVPDAAAAPSHTFSPGGSGPSREGETSRGGIGMK